MDDEKTRFRRHAHPEDTKKEINRVLARVKEMVFDGSINAILIVGLKDHFDGTCTPWSATVATMEQLMMLAQVGEEHLKELIQKVVAAATVAKNTRDN